MNTESIKNEIRNSIDSGDLEEALEMIAIHEKELLEDSEFDEILASLNIYAGNFIEASKMLEQLTKKTPNSDIYYNLAYVKKMLGCSSDAVVYNAMSTLLSDDEEQNSELIQLYDDSPIEKEMFDVVRNSPKRMYIILSSNYFGNIYQRTHHIAFSLSKMGQEVAYINPAQQKKVSTSIDLPLLEKDIESSKYYVEGVEVYQPFSYKLNGEILGDSTGEILQQLMNRSTLEIVVIAYLPEYIHILKQLDKEYFLIYDCVDDHSSDEAFWGSAGAHYDEQEMMDYADAITATASALYLQRAVIERRKNVYMSRNAVDESDFVIPEDDICPEDLAKIPSPRICYIGALYNWFDIDLFMETVIKNPEISFVVIGFGNQIFNEIPSNLHYLGAKEYGEIKRYLKHIDIGIIPFRVDTDVIVCCDAIKTYEYLMSNKPVITTMMPENSIQKPYNALVRDSDEFTAAIKMHLTQVVDRKVVDDFIVENNWNQRASLFMQIVNGDIESFETESVLNKMQLEFQSAYERYNHPVINAVYAMTLWNDKPARAYDIFESEYFAFPESRYAARQYFCALLANNEIERLVEALISADYLRVEQKCELAYRKDNGDESVLRYIIAHFLRVDNIYPEKLNKRYIAYLLKAYVCHTRNMKEDAYRALERYLVSSGGDESMARTRAGELMKSPLFLFLAGKILTLLGETDEAKIYENELASIKEAFGYGDEKNTKRIWENYFRNYWEQRMGKEQTTVHYKMIIDNLPTEIVETIQDLNLSICDAGCALGQGTGMLAGFFPDNTISGFDFSHNAITRAKQLYPEIDFYEDDFYNLQLRHDVTISSHTLEHFSKPFDILLKLMNMTDRYIVILVPIEKESSMDEFHEYAFTKEDFIDVIGDFKLVYYLEIKLNQIGRRVTLDRHILSVYERVSF